MERRFSEQAAMERNRIPYYHHHQRNRNSRTRPTFHPSVLHGSSASQQTLLSGIRSYDPRILALSTPVILNVQRQASSTSLLIGDDGYGNFRQENLRPTDAPFQLFDDVFIFDDITHLINDIEELSPPQERFFNLPHSSRTSPSRILSEEIILRRLKRRIHVSSANRESEICVICQAEYENGDDIGALRCGHYYHTNCIKSWLLEKDLCPLCKATALVM